MQVLRRAIAGPLALSLILLVAPTPGISQEYVIGIGDTVSVVVLGEAGLTQTYVVRPDGKIVLPMVGEITAAGLTSKQLADKLTTELKKYVRDPQVTVVLQNSVGRKFVFVLGQVARPGAFEIPPNGMNLAELLAAAGGPTANASLRKATILRKKTAVTVDLDSLLKGDASSNLPLSAGDVVIVSEIGASERIHVLGEVSKPGYYEFVEGDKVLDVVTKAGGVTIRAEPEKISVLREGGVLTADLVGFLHKGRWDQNVTIQKGDIIFVPETENRIVILGEVLKPGSYIFKPGDRVVALLSEAGGPSPRANLGSVGLIRQKGGQPAVVPVDLDKFFSAGDTAQNVEVKPGDVVYVPEKGAVAWPNILTTLGQLLTLFVFFR